ncbi:MAG TPA: polymer-forming cytoskeletal protein [Methylophaga aminisulfidivorans]|uniref:Polymer-forming cytoskeletal protein n=2 Tax=root TaxID=1 RepID=A0A7C1VZ64_9GAMM|nr:polymer-forming cytoskeletal protein [Methylophaga aminisulfidivorans]HEC73197.1 polymer-forming cytoskeletal protein [Methylophaga aminisulfidivorans]
MFSNKKVQKKKSTTRIDTLVGRQTHMKGDIHFSGGLRIDGTITGNIIADHEDALLTISDHGKVSGDVRVPNVIINGEVNGNVFSSEHVELAPKAIINGNLYYRMIEMAMGSEVNGHLIRAQDSDKSILDVEHEVFDEKQDFQLEQKS